MGLVFKRKEEAWRELVPSDVEATALRLSSAGVKCMVKPSGEIRDSDHVVFQKEGFAVVVCERWVGIYSDSNKANFETLVKDGK